MTQKNNTPAVNQETQPQVRQSEISLGALNASSPKDLVQGASAIANELANVIKTQKLSTNIQGREYVRIEGWTTLSTLMGVMPREVETVEQDNGVYVATIELIRMDDGMVLSRASAECGHDKPWNQRQHYARRSMAQTRATGKACRLAFSWIMGLAGYATTPYEEVQDLGWQNGNSQATQKQQDQKMGQGSGKQSKGSQNGAQGPTDKQLQTLNMQLEYLDLDRAGKLSYVNDWLQENGYEQVESSKQIPKKVMSELIDRVKEDVKLKEQGDGKPATEKMDEDPFTQENTEQESQDATS